MLVTSHRDIAEWDGSVSGYQATKTAARGDVSELGEYPSVVRGTRITSILHMRTGGVHGDM